MKRSNQKKVILSKKPRLLNKPQNRRVQVSRRQGTIYQTISNRMDHVNICVIRSLGGIGDILMTTPAVRQLREDFPNARITYATDRHSTPDYYELLKNASFIDEIADARYIDKTKYNAWVDISSVCIKYENAGLPPLNRIDIFARACGIPRLKNPMPFYKSESDERAWAKNFIHSLNLQNKNIIFLHTASFDKKRCWPAHRYEEFLRLAETEKPDIHFLLSDFNGVLPNKHLYTNCTDVTNPSIRYIAALIEQCDVFIGPDSGPMHLAGALQIPSLVLFGSIPPQARLNYYTTHSAVRAIPFPSCGPCWYAQCKFNTRCMTDITGQQVLYALSKSLQEIK